MRNKEKLLVLQLENIQLSHRVAVAKMENAYENGCIYIDRVRRIRREYYRRPALISFNNSFKFLK